MNKIRINGRDVVVYSSDEQEYQGEYTRRCIFVDNAVYERVATEDRSATTVPVGLKKLTPVEQGDIWSALQDFIIGVAVSKQYFGDYWDRENPEHQRIQDYYNDFALEYTNRIYQRLTDPRQVFPKVVEEKQTVERVDEKTGNKVQEEIIVKKIIPLTEEEKPKGSLDPIQSCKNYMVGIMAGAVQDYRNKYFDRIYDEDTVTTYAREGAFENTKKDKTVSYLEIFQHIDKYIEQTLDHSIYRKNRKYRNDLKLSIQLSLLNMLTVDKRGVDEVSQLLKQIEQRENYVIIWGKNNYLTKNIVLVYIIRVFRFIQKEFDIIEETTHMPEDTVSAIMKSAMPEIRNNIYEEQ